MEDRGRRVRRLDAALGASVLVVLLGLTALALAQSDSMIRKFELGDSVVPEIPGTGDIASVTGIPGPDWQELFTADGSLRDEVGADGNPPANGVPDFVDVHGGHQALFIGDDISASSRTDGTVRFGGGRLETGTISSDEEAGNTYVYSTFDENGDQLTYVGVERLLAGPATLEIEFNQDRFRPGHGWPGVSGWEIVGRRQVNDFQVTLTLGAGGEIAELRFDRWNMPQQAGLMAWENRLTQLHEGCNLEDPAGTLSAGNACVFRNDDVITTGDWPSYNAAGETVGALDAGCFYEIGLNLTKLLQGAPPSYTTVRVRTPSDLAFGHFGEGQ